MKNIEEVGEGGGARKGVRWRERKRDRESRGFSGTTGLSMGLGMPAPLPPPGAGTTTIMTTMGTMSSANMSSITTMRPGMSSAPQCRQPPAYKVAQQMARLHRLGRANSHEGVTYRATDHEDGTTTSNQIALPFTHKYKIHSHIYSYIHLSSRFTLMLRLLIFLSAIVNIYTRRRMLICIGESNPSARIISE